MRKISSLKEDPRFESHGSFVSKMMGALELTDVQVDALLNPSNIKCESTLVLDIVSFIQNSEKLMVCGDYDADGVCSTSMAIMIANHLGIEDVGYYIPNRFNDGYGVTKNTVQLAADRGYTDLLLVDNGVKAHAEIALAQSLGMRVAVVDHHLIETPLEDVLVLHPDLLDDYFSTMSASGLMYLVAESIDFLTNKIKAYGALATIADVMPLWGKNREIVLEGIRTLNSHNILNIDAISKQKNYNSQVLSFSVIPKINSVGRMADMVNMNTMVQYLLSDDPKLITQYASQIMSIDTIRKQKGKDAKEVALRKISGDDLDIIIDNDIHEGVLGIVANQVSNATQKPAILLKESGEVYKGSGRSNSVSLKDLFDQLDPNYFDAFGGHDFAFGMSIKKGLIHDFIKDAKDIVTSLSVTPKMSDAILIDVPLSAAHFKALEVFEPFGEGLKLPSFIIEKPREYKIVRLNGFGYKYVFDNYWLKDAVYFNNGIGKSELENARYLEGNFSLHPKFGLSFQIDVLK